MNRLSFTVVVVLLAVSCTSQVLNEMENDSPPGYADVVIGLLDQNTGKVPISIQSVEDSTDGKIKCGRGPNDKCKGHSRITWSIQNNSGVDVRVVMTKFKNETTNKEEKPFVQDPERPRIGDGDRRPISENIKNSPIAGTYKYDIVVYDSRGNEIGKRDPRIDI